MRDTLRPDALPASPVAPRHGCGGCVQPVLCSACAACAIRAQCVLLSWPCLDACRCLRYLSLFACILASCAACAGFVLCLAFCVSMPSSVTHPFCCVNFFCASLCCAALCRVSRALIALGLVPSSAALPCECIHSSATLNLSFRINNLQSITLHSARVLQNNPCVVQNLVL